MGHLRYFLCIIIATILMVASLSAQEQENKTAQATVAGATNPAPDFVKAEEILLPESSVQDQLSALERRLDAVENELASSLVPRTRGEELMSFLRTNRDVALSLQASIAKEVELNRELLASLGPQPKEGEPAEAEDIKEKRRDLTDRLVASQGQSQNANLLISRSAALISKISSEQTEALKESLTRQVKSPLSSEALYVTWGASRNLWFKLSRSVERWIQEEMTGQRWLFFLGLMGLVLGFGLMVILPFRKKLILRYGPGQETKHPSPDQRVVAIFAQAMADGLMPGVAAAAILIPFVLLGLSDSAFVELVSALVLGLVAYLVFRGAIRACLMPEEPHWRLWSWTGRAVRRLGRWLLIIAAAISLYLTWTMLEESFLIHGYLRNVVTFGLNTLIAISLFSVIRVALRSVKLSKDVEEDTTARTGLGSDWAWSLLLFAVQLTCISIPVFSVLGYVNLANYLTTRLVVSGLLIVAFLLAHSIDTDALGDEISFFPWKAVSHLFFLSAASSLSTISVAITVLTTTCRNRSNSLWLVKIQDRSVSKSGSISKSQAISTEFCSATLLFL